MGKTKIERRNRRRLFEAEWKLGGFRDRWVLGLIQQPRVYGVHLFHRVEGYDKFVDYLPLCNGQGGKYRYMILDAWPVEQTKQSYPKLGYSGVCKSCIGTANARLDREAEYARRQRTA